MLSTSILAAEINLSYLEFNDFYVPKDCIVSRYRVLTTCCRRKNGGL